MREEIKTNDRHRREYKFSNGYGASIIDNGYGSDNGLFELAVLCNNNQKLDYSTPITDDVMGWLSEKSR